VTEGGSADDDQIGLLNSGPPLCLRHLPRKGGEGEFFKGRLFAHFFQEWGGGAIQPQEYDQMLESLHNWVLRDSCLRRNDGNWDFAKVSVKRGLELWKSEAPALQSDNLRATPHVVTALTTKHIC